MLRTRLLRMMPRQGILAVIAILVAGLAASPQPAAAAPSRALVTNQHQLVPAYFYPTGSDATNAWHIMCRTMNVSGGSSTAVMNPNSGPGLSAIAAYTEAVTYCHSKQQKVIGYVHTSYAARPLASVLADIDAYYRFYDVDGIFVDEMANEPNGVIAPGMTVKVYYGRIYAYIKLKAANRNAVIGNPGSAAPTAWQIDSPIVDNLVVFEGSGSTYVNWTPPAWVMNRPARKFSHLVHSTPGAARHQVCSLSKARNAGLIDVTNDVLSNPWDTLSSYWSMVAPKCV